jgi:predicted Rdx family selenoprotein
LPKATRVAADIEDEYGITPELIGGGGGIFEVRVDEKVVFTNNNAGGVPPSDWVLTALRDEI